MYDTIVFATDGRAPAETARPHAFALAEAFDATLRVLYVLKTNEPAPYVQDEAAEADPDAVGREAADEVATAATERGIEAVEAVVRGPTADAILTYVEEHEADLVVMGTHGRNGLDRLVVGSVAETVVRESPVPVVTSRDGD